MTRYNYIKRFLYPLIFLSLYSHVSFSDRVEPQKTIHLSVPANSSAPPHVWRDPCDNTLIKGASIELLTKIFKKINFDLKTETISIEKYQPSQLKNYLINNPFTISISFKNPHYFHIKEPLFKTHYSIFIRKEDREKFRYLKRLHDHKGLIYTRISSDKIYKKKNPYAFNKLSLHRNLNNIFLQLDKKESDFILIEHTLAKAYLALPSAPKNIIESQIDLAKYVDAHVIYGENSAITPFVEELSAYLEFSNHSGETNLLRKKNMELWIKDTKKRCVIDSS